MSRRHTRGATAPALKPAATALALAAFLLFSPSCKPSKELQPAQAVQASSLESNQSNPLDQQIEERLQAIRQAGYPVTFQEFETWVGPSPSASENAALSWTNAIAAVTPIRFRDSQALLAPSARWSPAMSQFALRILQTNQNALGLLHRATVFSSSRYPLDWTRGSNLVAFGESAENAATVLELEAIYYSQGNRPGAAISSLETLGALARSLEEAPDDYLQEQRVLLVDMLSEMVERLVRRAQMSRGDLVRLQKAIRASQTPGIATRALMGKRCGAIFDFQHWRDQILPSLVLEVRSQRVSIEPLPTNVVAALAENFAQQKESDFLFTLDRLDDYIAASKLPYPQSLRAATNVYARVEGQRLPAGHNLIYSMYTLNGLYPGMEEDARACARLGATECAIAIELYRLAHDDQLPADLNSLTPMYMPAVPTDPFDGAPLRYKPLSKGYVIYSVGLAGRGDGTKGDMAPTSNDIRFVVER
jgi:hypothetical protein